MYVYKLSKFVVMLLLLTTALFIGTVSNESVNKDTSVSPATPVQSHLSPVQSYDLTEHLDLPTKFGDEDDVIESKTASDKKALDSIGSSAAKHGKCF